jgi:hypothetical protein
MIFIYCIIVCSFIFDFFFIIQDERTKAYKRIIDASKKIDEFRQHPQFKALVGSYVTTRTMECLNASKVLLEINLFYHGIELIFWAADIYISHVDKSCLYPIT